MSKIFWDSNLFIYLFEKNPEFEPAVASLRSRMKQGKDELLTSYLTIAEVQVKPMLEGKTDEAHAYAGAISGNASLIAFDREAANAYLAVRQYTKVRGSDAIQLACAASSGARFFVTHDKRLMNTRIPGYEVFVVSPANIPV